MLNQRSHSYLCFQAGVPPPAATATTPAAKPSAAAPAPSTKLVDAKRQVLSSPMCSTPKDEEQPQRAAATATATKSPTVKQQMVSPPVFSMPTEPPPIARRAISRATLSVQASAPGKQLQGQPPARSPTLIGAPGKQLQGKQPARSPTIIGAKVTASKTQSPFRAVNRGPRPKGSAGRAAPYLVKAAVLQQVKNESPTSEMKEEPQTKKEITTKATASTSNSGHQRVKQEPSCTTGSRWTPYDAVASTGAGGSQQHRKRKPQVKHEALPDDEAALMEEIKYLEEQLSMCPESEPSDEVEAEGASYF